MAAHGAAGRELQVLVDELAERLGRSVVIDDPGIRLVCASRHFGDEDPVRVQTMLQRIASSEIIAFVLAQEPGRWPGPGMLAGSAELGLLPRFCVPLRQLGRLLGHLMVIDAEQTLTRQEIDAIETCSRAVAAQMCADQSSDGDEILSGAALLGLLGTNTDLREAALDQLLRGRLLRDSPFCIVTVLTVESGKDTAAQVEMALRAAVQAQPPSMTLRSACDRDRARFLQLRDRPTAGEELRAQATRLLETVRPLLDATAACAVGVGGHAAGLRAAWVSHREAQLAAAAARRVSGLGGVGVWDELGELAVLVQLPDDTMLGAAVAEPLRALAGHAGGVLLEQTLRCFLDNGGSIPRTAAALHLHRTSVHYRLGKIREITGLDLDDGASRLRLHLGLRLRELGFSTE